MPADCCWQVGVQKGEEKISIIICIIVIVLEIGVGGFLCFREMQEKKICGRLLGLVGVAVFATIGAFFVRSELFVLCSVIFVVGGLAIGLGAAQYRGTMWVLSVVAALFVICLAILVFISDMDYGTEKENNWEFYNANTGSFTKFYFFVAS